MQCVKERPKRRWTPGIFHFDALSYRGKVDFLGWMKSVKTYPFFFGIWKKIRFPVLISIFLIIRSAKFYIIWKIWKCRYMLVILDILFLSIYFFDKDPRTIKIFFPVRRLCSQISWKIKRILSLRMIKNVRRKICYRYIFLENWKDLGMFAIFLYKYF